MTKDEWLLKYRNLAHNNALMRQPHCISINNETWEFSTDGFCFAAVKVENSGYLVVHPDFLKSTKNVLFPEINYEASRPWSLINKWIESTNCPTCGHTLDDARPDRAKACLVVVDRLKLIGLVNSIPITLRDTEWVRVEESDRTSTLILTNDTFRAGLCGMMGPTKPFGVTLKDFLVGDGVNAGK